MESNERNCKESLQAFGEFYDKLGPKMTDVHELMFKLVPHGPELTAPAEPCTGQNYREYQMSFARLAHYFHAIFDYWKQQVKKYSYNMIHTPLDEILLPWTYSIG